MEWRLDSVPEKALEKIFHNIFTKVEIRNMHPFRLAVVPLGSVTSKQATRGNCTAA